MTPPVSMQAVVADAMGKPDAMGVGHLALVEAVAQRTAAIVLERLAGRPAVEPLVDVAAVAHALGVSVAFVYEHADALGAIRLGSGPKARLRFDVEAAKAANARSGSRESQTSVSGSTPTSTEGRRSRRAARLPAGLPAPGSVLRSRPSRAA